MNTTKKAKQAARSKYEVHDVNHRNKPRFLGATMVRAANLALALEEAGVIKPTERVKVRNAIHAACDDSRSAGFSAGVAWSRGSGKARH